MIGRLFPPAFVFFPFAARGFAAFRRDLAFFMDSVYAARPALSLSAWFTMQVPAWPNIR